MSAVVIEPTYWEHYKQFCEENMILCGCGGWMHEVHTHKKDCLVINPKGRDYNQDSKESKRKNYVGS